MRDRLHVAYVTSEMAPFVKTGGLGDVAAALPKALGRLGHRVTVVLPRYGFMPYPQGEYWGSCDVPLDGVARSVGFFRREFAPGVEIIFLEYAPFFDRPIPYGEYGDNRLRFALLARAAIEYFRSRGERPDVFHCHDWQTGLVPVYLKGQYLEDPTVGRSPSVFTIHNIAYQGVFGGDTLEILGLPWHFNTTETLEFYGGVSYLKGGIVFSELVNTVSPQYARDIQGAEHGYGFDAILRGRGADLSGILNGVDYEEWDPSTDQRLIAPFSTSDLGGKAACKADLLRCFGLPEFPDMPLVGVVSRLIWQKGFDVVVEAWWDLLRRPMRMVFLGTGDGDIEGGLWHLQQQDRDRFAVRFTYDETLAHRVIAGSDMLLVPSRFEPCGLTQMYALRAGTVPIVRSTGGLVDTVEPLDAEAGSGTGFRFDSADGTGLLWAIDEALRAHQDQQLWRALQRRGMAKDFSWARSAQAYVELYRRAMTMA